MREDWCLASFACYSDKMPLQISLREKGFTWVHSSRYTPSIMEDRRSLEQLVTLYPQSENTSQLNPPFSTHTEQDPTQGVAPPTVDRSSHLNECNQDHPPQTCPEVHFPSDSRVCQSDSHSVLGREPRGQDSQLIYCIL